MAGIGFELRKIYNQEGILSKQRAYAYAGIVYMGPMLLGMMLTVGVVLLSVWARFSISERDYLLSTLTYSMIFSLLITTLFSQIITRFVADSLFENKLDQILPSYYGSSALMLVLGVPIYLLYLFFASRNFGEGLLCIILFGELCLVWNGITYLTAIKYYRKIIQGFVIAILLTMTLGSVSIFIGDSNALLFSVCVGYGAMLFWMLQLMQDYFPSAGTISFEFLKLFDQFGDLAKVGIYLFVGLFAHIVLNWFGPIGRSQNGFFHTAPVYDVPAMLAFLSTLVSTLNFIMSVEISFYPRFRTYFDLFNHEGSIGDIQQAEQRLLDVLANELKYVFWKQLLATIFFMFVGGVLLTYVPIGFNNQMNGYFLTLCLAYGIFAIGNVYLLMLLYFADYANTKKIARIFAMLSVILSLVLQFLDTTFLGYGFLIASLVLFLMSSRQLSDYTSDLQYHFLGSQKLVARTSVGWFEKKLQLLEKDERHES